MDSLNGILNMISLNFDTLDAVIHKHKEFRTTANPPRLQTIIDPVPPKVNTQLDLVGAATKLEMSQPVLHYLMSTILNSDNPMIEHQFRKLLAVTKLSIPSDDPMMEQYLQWESSYQSNLAEARAERERLEEEYDKAHKEYYLRRNKESNQIHDTACDLVDGAVQRMEAGETRLWDKLLMDTIEEELEFDYPLSGISETFKSLDVSSQIGVFETLRNKHKAWIEKWLDERTEYHYNDKFAARMVALEQSAHIMDSDEYRPDWIDEDSEDERFWYEMTLTEKYLSDTDSAYREESRYLAWQELNFFYQNDEDGFDTIYSHAERERTRLL